MKNNMSEMLRSFFWFLQQTLPNSELLKLEKRIQNLSSLEWAVVLKELEIPDDKIAAFEHRFYTKTNSECNDKILTRFDLETILQRQLPAGMPLAFRFNGNPNILRKPKVAIIGSRKPTFYGREQSYKFARELSKMGFTVLSGGAIGIDTIVNSTAIQFGSSCAVIGNGLNNPYPTSNLSLFQTLGSSDNGLVLSEFADEMPAQKWNFPKRNKTIAALADFVLVIEAHTASGSLITAKCALDSGCDVGAIPGPVDSLTSSGTNQLIQCGAFCIVEPWEVIERLKYLESRRPSVTLMTFTPEPATLFPCEISPTHELASNFL